MANAHEQLTREDFKAPSGQFRIIRTKGLNEQSSIVGDFNDWEFVILGLEAARAAYSEFTYALYDESGITNEHVRLTEPQRLLKFLRTGTPTSLHWIDALRQKLREADQSLVRIGTSEDELERFRIKICKVAVRELIDRMRIFPNNHDAYREILGLLRKEKLSPTEAGTSEHELERLKLNLHDFEE